MNIYLFNLKKKKKKKIKSYFPLYMGDCLIATIPSHITSLMLKFLNFYFPFSLGRNILGHCNVC